MVQHLVNWSELRKTKLGSLGSNAEPNEGGMIGAKQSNTHETNAGQSVGSPNGVKLCPIQGSTTGINSGDLVALQSTPLIVAITSMQSKSDFHITDVKLHQTMPTFDTFKNQLQVPSNHPILLFEHCTHCPGVEIGLENE